MKFSQVFSHLTDYQWLIRLLCALLLIIPLEESVQGAENDSVEYYGKTEIDSVDIIDGTAFSFKQLIVPTSLIAVGSWGISNGWFCSVKKQFRDELYNLRGEHRCKIDDYVQYLNILSGVFIGEIGVKSQHPFRERFAVGATAYATMGVLVNVLKVSAGEKRPDSDRNNSFPSGHTATAFMGAEIVRAEYGAKWGLAAYTLASSVAFLRLYNDRHWLNDVLAGAGIGILSARIGYWLLPVERKPGFPREARFLRLSCSTI